MLLKYLEILWSSIAVIGQEPSIGYWVCKRYYFLLSKLCIQHILKVKEQKYSILDITHTEAGLKFGKEPFLT